jgi:hypothetical protein
MLESLEGRGVGIVFEGGFGVDLALGKRCDDFAAFNPGPGTEVDEVGCCADGIFVVFDEDERVAFGFESLKSAE